jgi:hypothetical protein
MDELKTMTVEYLRELARKHLGKGHSKLKTKADLVEALKSVPEVLKDLAKEVLPTPTNAPVEPAAAAVAKTVSAQSSATALSGDAPLVEGFFVARVAGEDEARRHHLVEEESTPIQHFQKPVYDERLGELPDNYGNDSMVLLPKDPKTLYVFWDFAAETREATRNGLLDAKAVLRVFDGSTLIREVDFALESKSFYVHQLTPGRQYRVEAAWVGTNGESQRIGRSSNAIWLPAEGPSQNRELRFLRIPWELPLQKLKDLLRQGELKLLPKESNGGIDWTRTPLPHSASWPPPPPGKDRPEARYWTPPRSGHN